MGRVLLSILLGAFALLVLVGAAELLGAKNPVLEIVLGSLAVALYLFLGEFLVAPRDGRGLGTKWPTMIAMGAALLGLTFLTDPFTRGGWSEWATSLGPVVLLGWLGILAGGAAAGRFALQALSLGGCRRSLRTAAALMVGVALVVAAGVVPLTRADTFPTATPEKAVPVFWGAAILNLLGAACLMFIGAGAGRSRRPSPVELGFLAFLSFVVAFLLAPTVTFLSHGSTGVMAGILGGVCSVVEFAVMALIGSTALRLPPAEPA